MSLFSLIFGNKPKTAVLGSVSAGKKLKAAAMHWPSIGKRQCACAAQCSSTGNSVAFHCERYTFLALALLWPSLLPNVTTGKKPCGHGLVSATVRRRSSICAGRPVSLQIWCLRIAGRPSCLRTWCLRAVAALRLALMPPSWFPHKGPTS